MLCEVTLRSPVCVGHCGDGGPYVVCEICLPEIAIFKQ